MVTCKKYTLLNSGPIKATKVSMAQGQRVSWVSNSSAVHSKMLKNSKYDLYCHTQMFRFVFLFRTYNCPKCVNRGISKYHQEGHLPTMNTNYYLSVHLYLVLTKKQRENGLLGYLDPKKGHLCPLTFNSSLFIDLINTK